MERKHQQDISDVGREHQHQMTTLTSKLENDIKDMQNEALMKVSKLEEDMSRRETEMKHSLAICKFRKECATYFDILISYEMTILLDL